MLKEISYTNKYLKDLRKVETYEHFNKDLLNALINKLARGEKLERRYKDHKMLNQRLYGGANNFHLSADILVMYKMDKETLTLMRIGSHSVLLGNERGNIHFRR